MRLLLALAVLALLVATVVGWRLLRDRQRERFIDGYPYGKFLDRRLAARRPELSVPQRALVFDGLREYFQLCRVAKKRLVAMPSQAVDDAWHEFILFTRQYQQLRLSAGLPGGGEGRCQRRLLCRPHRLRWWLFRWQRRWWWRQWRFVGLRRRLRRWWRLSGLHPAKTIRRRVA